MANSISAIPLVRNSVAAVLHLHLLRPASSKKGKFRPAKIQADFGSAFCIVTDRYLLTAYHLLNRGKPRDPADKFYVFAVPNNAPQAFHFPVTAFPIEDMPLDVAVLEIGPCATPEIHIPSIPVTFLDQADGTRVLTVGFPSPEIVGLNVDDQLDYKGGQFFLKSHANEGIVSAKYDLGGADFYELNVGWHHGESGGPIVQIDGPLAAFSIMQHYRNITAPDGGLLPGPHRGRSLKALEPQLRSLGVQVV